MAFDEYGMSGTGTLQEYFHRPLEGEDDSFLKERDDAIERLCFQLFTEFVGIPADTQIEVIWPETGYYDEENYRESVRLLEEAKKKPGLVLIGWQMDDPIIALFKDGEGLAGFYASYRGMYQAGAFVAKPAEGKANHYFAHDFIEGLPMNEWIPEPNDEEKIPICAKIAEDFVTGKRKFFDDDEEE